MRHRDTRGDDPIDVPCSLIDGLSGRTQRARVWRGLTQEDAVTRTNRAPRHCNGHP